MANRPKRTCTYPGCSELVIGTSRCIQHKFNRVFDKQRASASERGYNYRWKKYRERFLLKNPLCTRCLIIGDIVPANVVDHIVPHKGDDRLFWDPTNHQALCKRCHDKKTATEDGGFGR